MMVRGPKAKKTARKKIFIAARVCARETESELEPGRSAGPRALEPTNPGPELQFRTETEREREGLLPKRLPPQPAPRDERGHSASS